MKKLNKMNTNFLPLKKSMKINLFIVIMWLVSALLMLKTSKNSPYFTQSRSSKVIKPIHCDLHDFNKPILANQDLKNDLFRCIKTETYNPNFQICLHNTSLDQAISGTLNNGSMWESEIHNFIKVYLDKDPDIGFIDIGANIGAHSLYATVKGHKVVAVEPVPANVRRLHKSVLLNGVQDRFTLVENAVFNIRTGLKLALRYVDKKNQGAYKMFNNASRLHYPATFIKSILLDDLLEVIDFPSAILKIDIEGLEPEALYRASQLFMEIKIPIIFMEWGQVKKRFTKTDLNTDNYINVVLMISMLTKFGYVVKETPFGSPLQTDAWDKWPWDVVFVKQT